MDTLTWRPGAADDAPLLFTLFAAHAAEEFAPLGLAPQQLQPLLQMQFRARQHTYAQNFPNALDMIVCLADGTAVGRHLIERNAETYRGLDLAVLPEHSNAGIGTWALRQVQQFAAVEQVPFHLRVTRANPALRLYERLGFTKLSADELSFEMVWHPTQKADSSARPMPEMHIPVTNGPALDRTVVLDRILPFLREIGLEIHLAPVASGSFLPGLEMVHNGLRVDLDTLLYPGDLLHEAGHLAVMTPARRLAEFPTSTSTAPKNSPEQSNAAAEEMGALAWSYAAVVHLGLPPELVFHPHGYRGQAEQLIQNFASDKPLALPFLEWVGLIDRPAPGHASSYPRLARWLRETTPQPEPSLEYAHAGAVNAAFAAPTHAGHLDSDRRTEGKPATMEQIVAPPVLATREKKCPPTSQVTSFQEFDGKPPTMKNLASGYKPNSFLLKNLAQKAQRGGVAALLLTLSLGASAQNAAQQKSLGVIFHPNIPQANGVEATSVPLSAPAGLAYDTTGNFYIASLNDHIIRKVDLKGIITTVAGDGEQGFGGDGGPATSAILDSPAGIAVDASGNLYIADTHNQRIRMVSAATGIITTIAGTGIAGYSGDGGAATSATLNLPVAIAVSSLGAVAVADTNNHRIRLIVGGTMSTLVGNGEQAFSGDGGLATAAGLDSPGGLAFDASNNLYIGDTHNQRVRLVTASTGIITTFAGTGTKTFGGDSGAATAASLARPRGLAVDSTGRVFIADSDNNRIRTVTSGTVTTLAGTGEEGFSGDTAVSTASVLDTPRATATFGASTNQSVAFTDANNQRARAVTSNGIINTVAGLGATGTPTLALTGATTVVYGTGTLVVTFANQSKTGTGNVTLYEGTTVRGTGTLSGNTYTFTLPVLAVGQHSLTSNYAGDSNNPATASGTFVLTVTQEPVTATATAISVAYGLPIPALSGTLAGVLPVDSSNVTAVYATTATQGSNAGVYPITVTLTGSASSNYTVTTSSTSGSVTITAAPTQTVLAVSSNPAYAGAAVQLTATVSATNAGTVGTPNGTVNFLNGTSTVGTAALVNGVATTSTTFAFGNGQSLTAVYVPATTPTQNWTTSTSAAISESVIADPDFSLSPVIGSQSVVPGQSVSYTINVVPNPAPFNNPVTFTVSGLPIGATATFSPTSVTPGSNTSGVVMTIKAAPVTGMLRIGAGVGTSLAFALLMLPLASRKRRKTFTRLTATFLLCFASATAMTLLSGCGTSNGFFGQGPKDYTLTVTGTSTSVTGTALVHTTTVTLTVQ